ncbi:glycosyltransferase family 9 protein [Algibacter amylolyticus]|uniref:Glycosyltransferase family 9 protein n=2 Tax=Algibacter amylolyticus TaxID=1608400 RepID=A0A5M7B1Q0_9FLAO|nr:glycosyltransferase family 9 protein [Algibacter amylolyticus]TSJ72946.1 glycosyltransferase family 9 protein [Algibacter amylolyticus]
MSFKTRVNNYRRKIMRSITKNIGSAYTEPKKGEINSSEIKTVLIIRPNHRLGNQLLLTPLVQEVINTFDGCEIDLFVKGGVAHPVFEKYSQINKIIKLPKKPFNNLFQYAKSWISIKKKTYDLVINADKNSSSGRLLTQMAKARVKVFGDIDDSIKTTYPDHEHISKYPIYNLRHYLAKIGLDKANTDMPVLNIKLDDAEIENGNAILKDIIKNDKKTICIYTNATGDKCYSEDWWETFYRRLKQEYPDYNIIEMLPIENISKINFKAPHFYSKDLREMGAIIHNTSIFIAADNGVMHLASASLTPCVGFFSVTNPNIYAPYGNGSVALHTNETGMEDWIAAINAILN